MRVCFPVDVLVVFVPITSGQLYIQLLDTWVVRKASSVASQQKAPDIWDQVSVFICTS